jgi:isoquinoline 1-oxidoreductase beta subunit
MSAIENVSRRWFLKGMASAGALVLGAYCAPEMLWGHEFGDLRTDDGRTDADKATLHPNVFVGVETDGTVWIVAHRSEMGTVIRTSLPMVLADELDADWKRVKIDQAIGDPRYGDQNTDGSHSIRSFFDVVRLSGATARLMLIQAAAQQWGVPVSECQTDLHVVVHSSSGRRLGYGELATAASKLPVPKKDEVQLKPKSAWRYIGKGMTSYDLTDLL